MYKYILSIEIYHKSFVVYIHSPSRVVDKYISKSQGKNKKTPFVTLKKKILQFFHRQN